MKKLAFAVAMVAGAVSSVFADGEEPAKDLVWTINEPTVSNKTITTMYNKVNVNADFKLDGANQVLDHPDRVWKNGMTDAEAHNLYPLVYAKEMVRSHELATGLRPMTYTDCGWAGFQQFSATWTGDTGGGEGPLAAMLQQGVVGHSNSSCDLVTTDIRALHFGFLSPWTLLDDWAFFFQPWCQEKDRLI